MKRILILCLGIVMSALAAGQPRLSEDELIGLYLQKRQALVQQSAINISDLSIAIVRTTGAAVQLSDKQQHVEALNLLLGLQRYMPLTEIPSFYVQHLAAYLYSKLGNLEAQSNHKARADALRQLLLRRIGSGQSVDDPLRLIMNSEIVDYAHVYVGRATGVKSETRNGRELMIVALESMGPKQVIVEIDPRSRAVSRAALDRYTPLADSDMPPEGHELVRQARAKREAMFNDKTFSYLELNGLVDAVMKESVALDREGKPAEALAKLQTIARQRPLEEIPTPRLMAWYSYLLGRTNQPGKQEDVRGQIFGIQQVIARSGDGKKPETAIEVLFIEEEYDWLSSKKLRRVKQALIDLGSERYDELTVVNAQGEESKVYFRVTRMKELSMRSLSRLLPAKTEPGQ